MRKRPYKKLKAIFLLTVFMFSTVAGFACSIGPDLKFNPSHHTAENAALNHEHGTAQHREEKTVPAHHRESSHNQFVTDRQKAGKTKDDCCSDEVMKFAQVDKRSPQSPEFSFRPPFIDLLVAGSNHFTKPAANNFLSGSKYFARSYHPPIPEIRIAIRSLQI